ncbi:MAG: ATP-binding protein [Actinomycetota bacterium]|nr:ATP-binding protein [Actinomycetota bacterium]
MPLPGGPSDKAGNSYERRWTVLMITDVIAGKAESLRIEVPGEPGQGAEFRLVRGGISEWHQAKRQRSGGPWTVAALANDKVLDPWWAKLAAGDRCAFVSMTGAQELAELVERAGDAASWQEFDDEFLKADDVRRHFQTIRRRWGDPVEEAVFDALRGVQVHLIDEQQLTQRVEDRLAVLVTGNPATAAAVLGQMVDGCCHRELTAADVWSYLGEHGIGPRGLAHDVGLRRRLADLVERHLGRLRPLYVGGKELVRPQADEAFARLGEGRSVVVSGPAGIGKSVVIAQTVQRARADGWPVAVVAADRLSQVDTPKAVGSALGLPDSPVTVLAGVAGTQQGLLVIDQLDAVSTVSGRHPERLALVADLVAEARSHPGVRVLIACRRFDLDNDRELRAVVASDPDVVVIDAGELADDEVGSLLQELGMSDLLSPPLQALLRVPLHLAIYVELVQRGVLAAASARTLTDLYDRFWDIKRDACRDKRGDGRDEWLGVVDLMVEEMSDRQELAVPVSRFDGLDPQVKAMASEGVVVADDRQLSFFHETFFDYCFARRFMGRGGTLRGLLASVEQDLFRRAQVRQVLVYLRSADRQAYLADLAYLLTAPEIRLHIKALTIAVLETVEPTPEEWAVLRPIVSDRSHPLHPRAWQSLRRNPGWFLVLDTAGDWQSWLASPDDTDVQDAVWALSGVAGGHAERVAALIGALSLGDPRLRWFLRMADVHAGRALFDLLLRAVGAGLYDGDHSSDLWYTAHEVAKRRPDWGVEFIASVLQRALLVADRDGEANPFALAGPLDRHHDSSADDVIQAAAAGAPTVFVECLLPVMVDVMRRNERPAWGEGDTVEDAVWSSRYYGSSIDVAAELFHGMDRALRTVSAADPARARPKLQELRDSGFESAWYLAARAYLGNPSVFASEAAQWLTAERGALRLGYSDAPYWASRELIAAIAPHLPATLLSDLERALLYYTTKWERTAKGRRARGYSELALLNAVPDHLRSEAGARRLGELRRKFEKDDVEPPRGVTGGAVPPPIPEHKAAKMNDAQWLRAIARHSGSDLKYTADGRLVGDAYAQSGVLESLTGKHPERFARLLLRFPSGTAQSYIDAILRGVAGARLDPELLLAMCRHAQDIGDPEGLRWIARLVETESAASLPAELLAIVASVATGAPDVPDEEGIADDVDSTGLNSTRGAAALALGRLVHDDPERLPELCDALRSVCVDPSMPVRAMAVRALAFVLYVDEDTAIGLFLAAVGDASDALLASSHVNFFLNHAIRRGRYAEVADVLSSMSSSASEPARQIAARQLAVASYLDPTLDPAVDEAFAGDEANRAAIAGVYAANVVHPERRERAIQMLGRALADDSKTVRDAAARACYDLKDERLDEFVPLFEHLVRSRALVENGGPVLDVIEQSRHPLPTVALDACEQFVAAHGQSLGDISVAAAGDAMHVVRIALRLHVQHADPEIRRRCLDLIDTLVAGQAYNIEKDLAAMER